MKTSSVGAAYSKGTQGRCCLYEALLLLFLSDGELHRRRTDGTASKSVGHPSLRSSSATEGGRLRRAVTLDRSKIPKFLLIQCSLPQNRAEGSRWNITRMHRHCMSGVHQHAAKRRASRI